MPTTDQAGWYPDPQESEVIRYWDGSQWTQHTATAASPSASPIQPAEERAGWQPRTSNQQPNWFVRHKILSGVLAVLVLLTIIGALSGNDNKSGADDSPLSGVASTAPGRANAPASMEDRFMAIVADGQKAAANTDNGIAVVQARKSRATALCALLPPSLEVKNWSGTVSSVGTELGGDKGVIEVDLGNDVKVATWNNSLSDVGSHTLIDPDSDLYSALAGLSAGDSVSFGGQFISDPPNCLDEQSLIDENGMLTPTFTFRYADITTR